MSSSGSSVDVYTETLAVFDQHEDPSEPLTTPEVADSLDVARRTVYKRLQKLVSRGEVKTKKAGANARVWWRPLDGPAHVAQASDSEPRRSEIESTVDEVLERITDGFYGLDEQFRFTYVNSRAEDLLDLDSAVLGQDIHDELSMTDEFEAALHEASETQEPVVIEDYYDPLDAWFENAIYPSESGLSVYFQNISERKRLEHDLQTEEEHFRTALENTPLVAFRLDTNLRYTWITNPHEDFDPDAVIGKRDDELLPPDAAATIMEPKRKALETGERVREEVTYELPSGVVSYDLTVVPIQDESGEITGLTCATLDITGRKEREQELHDAKLRLEAATEAGDIGTWETRIPEEKVVTGPWFAETFGIDPDAAAEGVSSDVFFSAIHEDDRERVMQKAQKARESCGEVETEYRVWDADGDLRWVVARGHVECDNDGNPVKFHGAIIDITERRETEEALRASEEQLRLALEAAELGTWELDLQTEESPARSPLHDRIFGYDTLDDWSFEQFIEHVHPEDRERVRQSFEEAVESGKWTFECRIIRADDVERWIRAEGEFHYDDDDEPIRAVGIVQDITERKERERELEEYRRRNETLVENFPGGVVALVDENLRFITFAGTPQGVPNTTRDDFEGELVRDVLPPEIADVVVPGYEAALEGKASEFEEMIDGRVYHYNFVPVRDDQGEVFAVTAMSQDITDRKRRERDLKRYERIVETVPDGVYALDSDDRFVLVNQALCDLVGYDREELLGAHPTLINSQAVNDTANELQAKVQAGERDVGVVEFEFETATGETVPVEGRIAPLEYADGHVGRCGVVRDITVQKRREEELAALNRLNSVFQDVTHAIIESSSREEIEQTITERLTNSDSYEYAWMGHLDRQGENIVPQIAGMNEASLSEIPLSTATDSPTNHPLAAEAIRTGEVQVTYDGTADTVFDQWNQSQDNRHRAGISVPITYENRVYGVLNVYTARENAFDESERHIIRRISEVVGHAVNSIERKRALLEDRVQEITFKSPRFAEVFTEAADDESFTISLEKFVPLPDDRSVAYYSLDGLDPAVFIDVIEEFNPKAEYHVTHEEGSRARVEVQQSNSILASELAKYNSWIVDGTLQNGEFRFRVQMPQHSHVREVKDAVKESYPDVEVVAQTEVERESPRRSDVFSALDDQLTERQRTTLEVAYYSGFFNWPRAITGEELAERLDVTPGTVSHHLRHGERKLMSAFFESTA